MRHIAFATSLFCSLMTYHEAMAQGFWSVPPGADLSYRFGIDLGNGFGYGYGFGVGYGSVETPGAAAADGASDLLQFQNRQGVLSPEGSLAGEERCARIGEHQQQASEGLKEQSSLKFQHTKSLKESGLAHNQQDGSHRDSGLSRQLTSNEFDRSTGKIVWPTALRRDSFSLQRSEIESLAKSVEQSDVTAEQRSRLGRKAKEMHQELRKQILEFPMNDYLDAYKFLKRLALEVQRPIG